MEIVLWVAAAVGTALLAMILADVHESFAWIAGKIVRRAARRLPAHLREVREEEWLAELQAFEGMRLVKLLWALQYLWAARKIRRTRTRGTAHTPVPADKAEVRTVIAHGSKLRLPDGQIVSMLRDGRWVMKKGNHVFLLTDDGVVVRFKAHERAGE